jgi:hypothetical protein
MQTQNTITIKHFRVGENPPKRRKWNSSFKKDPPLYLHDALRTQDPMQDLASQWAKRMPT